MAVHDAAQDGVEREVPEQHGSLIPLLDTRRGEDVDDGP